MAIIQEPSPLFYHRVKRVTCVKMRKNNKYILAFFNFRQAFIHFYDDCLEARARFVHLLFEARSSHFVHLLDEFVNLLVGVFVQQFHLRVQFFEFHVHMFFQMTNLVLDKSICKT